MIFKKILNFRKKNTNIYLIDRELLNGESIISSTNINKFSIIDTDYYSDADIFVKVHNIICDLSENISSNIIIVMDLASASIDESVRDLVAAISHKYKNITALYSTCDYLTLKFLDHGCDAHQITDSKSLISLLKQIGIKFI